MKVAIFFLAVFVAVVAARPKSDCEKHRETAERTGGIMKLIPKCKENGDYETLQCYKDSPFCVCYTKDGHAASPILKNLKECGCFLRQKEKKDRGHDNAYIPQCENDGSWTKKQCWDFNKSCWCVDKDGNQVGKITGDGDSLNCE